MQAPRRIIGKMGGILFIWSETGNASGRLGPRNMHVMDIFKRVCAAGLAASVATFDAPPARAATIDALMEVDDLGYTCIPDELLEAAWSADGPKSAMLPQTCLPEPCREQITGPELVALMGRPLEPGEWDDYVARYAETCVAETRGIWPDLELTDVQTVAFRGDGPLGFWAPLLPRVPAVVPSAASPAARSNPPVIIAAAPGPAGVGNPGFGIPIGTVGRGSSDPRGGGTSVPAGLPGDGTPEGGNPGSGTPGGGTSPMPEPPAPVPLPAGIWLMLSALGLAAATRARRG